MYQSSSAVGTYRVSTVGWPRLRLEPEHRQESFEFEKLLIGVRQSETLSSKTETMATPKNPDSQPPKGPGRQFFVPSPDGPSTPSARRPATPKPATPKPAAPKQAAPKRAAPKLPAPKPAQPSVRSAAPTKGRPSNRTTVTGSKRSGLKWLMLLPLILVVGVFALLFKAYSTYNEIERVDLAGVLDPVSGDSTNYLLVGSDSRDAFDPEGSSGVTGRRSDTIIVLRTTPAGSSMMSIPRDLWVTVASTGKQGRINGAYNEGPANLVRTVQENLDIPINHYMEVGFGSFSGLVDAIGGVTIDFPYPAYDQASGLVVDVAGPVTLTGTQALAYARSRNYTERVDGKEVKEPTADLGRQQRQQLFLRTALKEVGATRNPLTLLRVADSMSSELIIDSGLGFGEAVSFVRKLGSSDPATVMLPTEGVRKGKAAVLVLVEPEAQVVLQEFR